MSETRPAYYQDQQCRKTKNYGKFQLGNEREERRRERVQISSVKI